MTSELTVLVLAAGKGTRMKAERAKVLHPLAGRPLISHVLAAAALLQPERCIVVLAPGMKAVEAEVKKAPIDLQIALQEPQLGTGHAVMSVRDMLPGTGVVLILYGDTPLASPATLQALIDARERARAAVAVLGMRPPNPTGYGRLSFDAEGLAAIVEERHAGDALKREGLCNSGVMAIDASRLPELLDDLEVHPEKGELYLTDIVEHASSRGWMCTAIEAPWQEGIGINSQEQRAAAEAIMQGRLRRRAMEEGVTLVAPDTVFLSADSRLAEDVEIHPYVVIGPGVQVGRGATILPFCHLEGVVVGEEARIGPFARLRPGTVVGAGAHVGNFVEAKNAQIAPGAKANHLSYLGDAAIGERANIGAGTITCNYDGFEKHHTEIGEGAFIGSNTALVAPVVVGAGAIVGAGSTIVEDIPDDAIAVARADQRNVPEAARRFRQRRAKSGESR